MSKRKQWVLLSSMSAFQHGANEELMESEENILIGWKSCSCGECSECRTRSLPSPMGRSNSAEKRNSDNKLQIMNEIETLNKVLLEELFMLGMSVHMRSNLLADQFSAKQSAHDETERKLDLTILNSILHCRDDCIVDCSTISFPGMRSDIRQCILDLSRKYLRRRADCRVSVESTVESSLDNEPMSGNSEADVRSGSPDHDTASSSTIRDRQVDSSQCMEAGSSECWDNNQDSIEYFGFDHLCQSPKGRTLSEVETKDKNKERVKRMMDEIPQQLFEEIFLLGAAAHIRWRVKHLLRADTEGASAYLRHESSLDLKMLNKIIHCRDPPVSDSALSRSSRDRFSYPKDRWRWRYHILNLLDKYLPNRCADDRAQVEDDTDLMLRPNNEFYFFPPDAERQRMTPEMMLGFGSLGPGAVVEYCMPYTMMPVMFYNPDMGCCIPMQPMVLVNVTVECGNGMLPIVWPAENCEHYADCYGAAGSYDGDATGTPDLRFG